MIWFSLIQVVMEEKDQRMVKSMPGDQSSKRCHGQPLRSFLKWYRLCEERTRTQAQYYHYHHHPHLLTPSLHFLILIHLQFGFFSDFKDKETQKECVSGSLHVDMTPCNSVLKRCRFFFLSKLIRRCRFIFCKRTQFQVGSRSSKKN